MTVENYRNFIDAVISDESLQKKTKDVMSEHSDSDLLPEAFKQHASNHGYEFEVDHMSATKFEDLTDQDLENLAGAGLCLCPFTALSIAEAIASAC